MAVHETPGKVNLWLRVPAGSVSIRTAATDRTQIEVTPRRRDAETLRLLDEIHESSREISPGVFEVRLEVPRQAKRWVVLGFLTEKQFDITITAPKDAEVDVETVSADVRGRGEFGSVRAQTVAGDISFQDVTEDGEFKSVSGDLELETARRLGRVQTISGDVNIRSANGQLVGKTVSGDIRIGSLGNGAQLTSISGDVNIAVASSGELNIKTTSGDIEIGVARGLNVWLDISSLSGDTNSYLEAGDEQRGDIALEIRASTLSGDATLRTALGSPSN